VFEAAPRRERRGCEVLAAASLAALVIQNASSTHEMVEQ